jgi:ribosome-associated heat shock protein Hsp15
LFDFQVSQTRPDPCSLIAMVDNILMDSIRIDKWLWAARFFKTRALASKSCDLGRILSNGHEAKPSREVRVGDHLVVKNEGGEFQIEVLALSQMRGPAAMAQTLYSESEASKAARAKAAAERKAMQQFAPLPERRPSKRDRRRIIQFRGGA